MRRIVLTALIVLTAAVAMAQDKTWSQKMTKTAMTLWPDSVGLGGRWSYDQGVILKGVEGVWYQTADAQYFKYIKGCMDRFVNAQGEISGGYKLENYNIDNVLCGRSLLTLFEVTGAEKYNKAVQTLRSQLKNHPRIPEGGFWHKKIYPNQMWLDGLYMGEPFYTEYSVAFNENNFDDIANQFILMESHARDAKTGLLYHAWDQSKQQKWANKETGLSPHFWGRAMGWYGMALVDVLDKFPVDHPKRAELLAILNRFVAGVQKYQDSKSEVWWQVLDRGGDKGNYLEASASCMFVYALSKAVRQGYIPASYKAVADKGFNGIIKQFISTDAKGQTNLNGTVSVAGLGGNPYRDGSYEYYLSEKVVTNDPKGVGAFILCAVEHERLSDLPAGNKKVVMLDSYFNNEHRNDKVGGRPDLSYHYKWEEMDNNGFSLFGRVFENYGFKTATLYNAPTAANLKKASVYVLVDPDFPKENPEAKYIETSHIKAVADWVKAGGVLLVFNNDTGNAEFKNLNNLMAKFGMQYNLNSRNRVTGSQFEMGAIQIPAGNAIFKTAKKVYVKEISTLNVKAPAKSALTDKGDAIIAVAKYGKGAVFAVGDPWFYNEYTDGRKLPADFENFKAANDLVKWVRTQLPAKN